MNTSPKRGPSRSSLACLPCRSRHLKCDGNKPQCSRCSAQEIHCDYTKSRRGGLDRAALAESKRRKRDAAWDGAEDQPMPPASPLPLPIDSGVDSGVNYSLGPTFQTSGSGSTLQTSRTTTTTSSPFGFLSQVQNVEEDTLIDSYYHRFHKLHPLVVPRRCLARLNQDPSRQLSLRPLIAVLRLIGYIYKYKQWPAQATEVIDTYISQTPPQDPFLVQARLLYSIALFWYDDKQRSAKEKTAAGQLAVDLGMHRQAYALQHGEGDAILTESWRRTWWWNYIIEAYYLGTLGTLEFAVLDIEADVDLPCSEDEYESGKISEPRTLEEYGNREFLDDEVSFSSFAHLIGAVECAASAIRTVPKILAGEVSAQMLQASDSMLDGWLLLLPDGPKHVVGKDGKIDELLYQAHLVVHVASIGLHRPLSDLKFNQVESISSCAREPPREIPTPDLINIHTLRVLRAIEAQIRLLALPVRPFHHTPFTTCMVSEGTLALLSACRFQLKGRELQIARDQIRMTIGCLKTLGSVWPRTGRNVGEIQMIARHVLGVGGKGMSKETPKSDQVPGLTSGNEMSASSSEGGQSSIGGFLSNLGDIDLCGFGTWGEQMVNIGDLDGEPSWWTNDP